MHVGCLVLTASSVEFISVLAIQLRTSPKYPSIEEVIGGSPHLLDIPDTSIVGRMISKSPSPMYPSFECKDIQTCFGDEITAIKSALLESSGETSDHSEASDAAVHFGQSLKSAIQALDSLEGFFFTRKKTARHAVSAMNYFLAAFYFARSKVFELRDSASGDRTVALRVMQTLLDRAAMIARSPKSKLGRFENLDWLTLVRDHRRFSDHTKHWFTLWLVKHENQKIHTVPIPNLAPTFLAIWALGKVALVDQKIVNKLHSGKEDGLKKQTIEYWKLFPDYMANKCSGTPNECEADFVSHHSSLYGKALTVSKAKYLVEHFAQAHSSFLFSNAKMLYEWLIDGANPSDDQTKNPFSIKA